MRPVPTPWKFCTNAGRDNVLYYTMLYCAILGYAILAILFYAVLYYTRYAILYYAVHYFAILYYPVLYYTILYYTVLYYTILYYTILYYTILYYTVLCYIILCYTMLYSTTLYPKQRPSREREREMEMDGRIQRCRGTKHMHTCTYMHVKNHTDGHRRAGSIIAIATSNTGILIIMMIIQQCSCYYGSRMCSHEAAALLALI